MMSVQGIGRTFGTFILQKTALYTCIICETNLEPTYYIMWADI